MWRIIKAEVEYNPHLFIGIICLSMIIMILTVVYFMESLGPYGWLLYTNFVFALFWNKFRNRENRDRKMVCLPMPVTQIAISRLGMPFTAGFVIFIVFAAGMWIMGRAPEIRWKTILVTFGIHLVLVSLYYICRDFLRGLFLRKGFTRERILIILVPLILILNLLTLAAVLSTRAGKPPLAIGAIEKFIIEHSPFTDPYAWLRIIVVTAVISGLSVFSFIRRNSYTT